MGRDSTEIAQAIINSLTDFNRAAADALAAAIIDRLAVNKAKANWFNAALRLSGVAILLIALARVVGGL